IKLMGGLAPCGRECCCVRSLQEPKKVSVKMAKNQGLSLNPSKISGLCGRLMCCLSYENDYYAEVCKKVPKIGSEATTPDGKGTVVNVNMLKMIVKVKIEQGESVTYKDFPLDKISFMRGSEVIGTVGGDEADEEEEIDSESLAVLEEDVEVVEKVNPDSTDGKNGDRRQGDNRNGKHNGDRQNRKNGDKQNGDRQSGEQGMEPNPNQGGKNRNKKHNRHNGGDGAKEGSPAGETRQNQGGQGGKRSNQGKGQNGQNGQNGQGNSSRNRKKHRPNKNGGAKNGANSANGANGDGQKNNA
ncbi:MAG: regulatory iron-sulfur-containing complex subunit RicT, partial [Candidatus Coproplasma sp.]